MKLRIATLALVLASCSLPAFAQGCAMCYSSAAGTTKDGQRAISRGVLVLLIPPLGFMTLGVGVAVRYGKKRDEAHNQTEPDE
ncbi:MAG TPA: hypothetical protein VH437_16930 [Terriglobales bacterium]